MDVNISTEETRNGLRMLTAEEMAFVNGGQDGTMAAGGFKMLIDWLISIGKSPSIPPSDPQPPSGNDRPKHVGRGCNVGDW